MIRFSLSHAVFAVAFSAGLPAPACGTTVAEPDASADLASEDGRSVGGTALAHCPAFVTVGLPVKLGSDHRYSAANDSDSEGSILIVEEMVDSQGHHAQHSERVPIPARSSIA